MSLSWEDCLYGLHMSRYHFLNEWVKQIVTKIKVALLLKKKIATKALEVADHLVGGRRLLTPMQQVKTLCCGIKLWMLRYQKIF